MTLTNITRCDKCGMSREGWCPSIEFITATFENQNPKHFCRNCWTLMEEAEVPVEFPDGLR